MRVALLLAYDGTDYRGYQRQAPHHEPTVQGVLEGVIARVAGAPVATVAAGRTDAGVHAAGQVVTFTADRPARFMPEDWQHAINALVPHSMAVQAATAVAEDVSARYAALRRVYRYRVLCASVRDPLRERYVHRVTAALDVNVMQAAGDCLVGTHDFAAFGHSPSNQRGQPPRHTVRDLQMVAITQADDEIWLEFAANAFLTGMVRRLVGTLLLVGTGKLTPDDVAAMLAARQSDHPGATAPPAVVAPPQGLCLLRVDYPSGTIMWPAKEHDGDDHDHL
ncbi:MAG TPA: tRNA pseudouridine(38-40) synthase TruA [Ktedonobacterales bacterium]|nr:tRNA pseudouridine(38-40) synthase TruA [Ktedonobacterales bacterium]